MMDDDGVCVCVCVCVWSRQLNVFSMLNLSVRWISPPEILWPQTFSLSSDLLIINLDLEKVSARLRLVGP